MRKTRKRGGWPWSAKVTPNNGLGTGSLGNLRRKLRNNKKELERVRIEKARIFLSTPLKKRDPYVGDNGNIVYPDGEN
jgi:hypothetical protein